MKKRRLVAPIAVMATVSLLFGVSAFADNRPRERTESRIDRSERGNDRRAAREAARGERQPAANVQRNDAQRRSNPNRQAAPVQRNNPNRQAAPVQRSNPNRQAAPVQRNNPNRQAAPTHRTVPNRQVAPAHRAPSRQPHYVQGRITRTVRHGSGYHVFVAGNRYPYYVPAAYYHPSRFRVGLVINIGGFYNPRGYYDYYHAPVVAGRVRGYVEDVDYRRGTFIVRNEATGSYVTAVIRDRRMGDIRRGDYVELSGDWRRNGVFDAYRIHLVDYGYGYGR